MKPIKVLRIINRFNLGGITYNVSYLSRYMPENYETLLAGGPEEEGEASSLFIPHSLGLEPKVITAMRRTPNLLLDLKAYREIKKLIREFKPDIVHTHASKAGAIGRLAAAHCGVQVIVHTFHGHVFSGYFGPLKTAVIKMTERFLAKKTNAVIAISVRQKEELSAKYRICAAEKIEVVPLGFDLGEFTEDREEKRMEFRKKYGLEDGSLAIGIIGRLAPVKNHALFVEAVAACKKSGRPVTGVIIGDGETKEEIIKTIRMNGCTYTATPGESADFIFTSWITEVDRALPGLDIVCLTSKNEGTPVSLIEAQAAGKFIVSTNVGGISDILHAKSGLLSAEGDREGYITNLMEVVKNFESYQREAGQASAEVIRRFSYQRLCADMDKVYRRLRLNT
jgi:glycosyltransferase involved in cell wall biosynthesis